MEPKQQKLFFSGIGGSGMSALAVFMAERGHIVSGSDRAFDTDACHPVRKALLNKGISVLPQDGRGLLTSLDRAVFSTAVEPDNPDFVAARRLGIPVMMRPDLLAELVSRFETCAVAGTSGKSTTAGMLAFLMRELGLRPNFIGGGRVRQFRSLENAGNSLAGNSDFLVVEACESDGSIVKYRPRDTILLNLALDHHPVEETAALFRTLIENTKGLIVANADDLILRQVLPSRAVTFSIENPSRFRPDIITCEPLETRFVLDGTPFVCPLPGRHNLYNALSCIALLSSRGIPLADMASPLSRYQGIERRFDIHLNDGRRLVIDDYAHNPHKIEALMRTVRGLRDRVCYIFQPHGYGPTRLMKDEYCRVFAEGLRETDRLYLLPIYFAGGTARKDISSNDLAEVVRSRGKSAEALLEREGLFRVLDRWDAYVVFGARDDTLSGFAGSIARLLSPSPIL